MGKFILNKKQFRILVAFPCIFVGDTKIIYGYNFAAPLTCFNNFSNTDSILKMYVINFRVYICHQIPGEFKVQKQPPVVFFK